MGWTSAIFAALFFIAYTLWQITSLLAKIHDRMGTNAERLAETRTLLGQYMPYLERSAEHLGLVEKHTQRAVIDQYEGDAYNRMHKAITGNPTHDS